MTAFNPFPLLLCVDIIEHMKRTVVEKAYRYGLILTPEALEYLVFSEKDVEGKLRELARRGVTTVRLEDLAEEREEEKGEVEVLPATEEEEGCEGRIRILLYIDPDEVEPADWDRERERILLERLEYLGELLRGKARVSPTSYSRALRSGEERDVIGIVAKIDETPSGKVIIHLEDGEDAVTVIHTGVREAERKMRYLVQDSVVALKVVGTGDVLLLRDITFPGTVGFARRRLPCPKRLLVVPNPYSHDLSQLLNVDADAVVLLSNVVHIYRSANPREEYRKLDALLTSQEKEVFVVPGMYDAVRSIPPHPPLDHSLLPDSSSSDHVHLLGSPAIIKVDSIPVLLYDGEFYSHTGRDPETMVYTRLVQPDISTYPYRSSRDYSLLRRLPQLVLMPVGGRPRRTGDVDIVTLDTPYIVDVSTGKVIRLEEGRG